MELTEALSGVSSGPGVVRHQGLAQELEPRGSPSVGSGRLKREWGYWGVGQARPGVGGLVHQELGSWGGPESSSKRVHRDG